MLPFMKPLIAICGTTGVGKSKLAIELALALSDNTRRHGGFLGARIINADAMQVYAGLDVLTNKVPLAEQCGIEHLLMSCRQPGEQYVVGQWVKEATRLINETHERNQVPIVVGGTSYWIQHLIFPERLVATFDNTSDDSDQEPKQSLIDDARPENRSQALLQALSMLPPELLDMFNDLPHTCPSASTDPELVLSLHNLLKALDPIVAQRWHWKDIRKVLRNLEIIKQTGRLPSEIINEQSRTTPQPSFRTLCFWLFAKPEVLNPRLDVRIDQMLEQGLLEEVEKLRNAASEVENSAANQDAESSTDYTLGLYQSIGYREFSLYLAQKSASSVADSQKAFLEAVERMKLSTRKYARQQVSWIRNKLLPRAYAANAAQPDGQDVVSAYLLDATELGDKWFSDVQSKANSITGDFLENRVLPDPLSLSDTARAMLTVPDRVTNPNAILSARRRVVCPACTVREDQPIMIEETAEWAAHVKTRRHRRLATQASRRAEGEKRANQKRKEQAPSDDEDTFAENADAARSLFDP